MLCSLGDLLEDIAVRRPQHIRTGADTHVRIDRRRGGSAANTAVAAARLGAPVRFIGRVGADAVGRGLIDALGDEGVDARVQVGGRTGTIIVLVDDDGERTMLGDRGAAADLADPVDLDDVTWLHVPAYSLVGDRVSVTARRALRTARDRAARTSIDVSSLTLLGDPEAFLTMVRDLAPDVTFANEAEFSALGGHAAWLHDDGILVVKRGPGPASVFDGSGEAAVRPAASLDDVGDTTGAGDAFAAGFIVSRMASGGLEEALDAGHASAAAWLTDR